MVDHSAAPSDYDRLTSVAAYDLDEPDLKRRLDELPGWAAEAEGIPVEWSFCANAVVSRAPARCRTPPTTPSSTTTPS